MKALTVALVVFLCTMMLCSSEKVKIQNLPACCISFTSRPIPRKLVVAYFRTSSMCSTDGVIFLIKKGTSICANPRDSWVQDYIRDLEASSLNGPAGTRETFWKMDGQEDVTAAP
ncbi:C-C motif chemokine 3-like [Octodon degus]|uniref:C-C motif chemokine n=1 Tax=Octodon degus TaxID=10160 RepID=A0A6P6DGX1_OCTDE|nr:C-C motif chemokine 3-like [Octodon degus]